MNGVGVVVVLGIVLEELDLVMVEVGEFEDLTRNVRLIRVGIINTSELNLDSLYRNLKRDIPVGSRSGRGGGQWELLSR